MRATEALFMRVRKFALTTKKAKTKGYYKGTRTGRMGGHTQHGAYKMDWNLVRTYVVPAGLKEFKLTPFVTRKLQFQPGKKADGTGPPDGNAYLEKWKRENGDD